MKRSPQFLRSCFRDIQVSEVMREEKTEKEVMTSSSLTDVANRSIDPMHYSKIIVASKAPSK